MLTYLAQDDMIDINIHGAGLLAFVVVGIVASICLAITLTDGK